MRQKIEKDQAGQSKVQTIRFKLLEKPTELDLKQIVECVSL